MPQAKFFGRRWRLATDFLPIIFYPVLTVLALVMLIMLLSLVAMTLSRNYECPEFTKVGIAMYGSTAAYVAELLVFELIVWVGWNGGPLAETKRMPMMSWLIYAWFGVLFIKFVLAIYGFYVLYSPTVSKACWSSNPCDSFSDSLPKVCLPGASGDVRLTPACQIIWDNRGEFISCFRTWSDHGATWMRENYNGTNESSQHALFDYPGIVTCNDYIKHDGKFAAQINPYSKESIFSYFGSRASEANATYTSLFPSVFQGLVLQFISPSVKEDQILTLADLEKRIPWSECLSARCRALLSSNCTMWNEFLTLPSVYTLKGFFAAVVYTSEGVILVTVFILFFSFNAFPDYESEESWEGLFSAFARRAGYLESLENLTTEDGSDALAGIGSLLHKLFGGADLDISDLILGLYLVHLRQIWKRKEHALKRLEDHGYSCQERHLSTWWSRLMGFILFPLFKDRYHRPFVKISLRWKKRMERNVTSSSLEQDDVSQRPHDSPSEDTVMRQLSSSISGQEMDDLGASITLQHSFIRINSETSSTMEANGASENCIHPQQITCVQQPRALMTPLGLNTVTLKQNGAPTNTSECVSMYMGSKVRFVEHSILEEVRHFLPIARASYGLMERKWKGGAATKCHTAALDKCLSCVSVCIPDSLKKSYYQKRNLKSILRITKTSIEDLLYISYTSSPLGILPYLILVDKVTKNICISIRGTVGFSDLVTDLLSSPKNFNRQVSPWTLDQIRTLTGRDSEEMYAHEGIVSSAKALLEDLKKVGIYEAIQHLPGPISADADLLSPESSYNDCQIKEFDAMEEEEQMEFSTSRAIALIQHAIHGQKYGLVITGHSLGGLVDDTFRAISESFCTSIVVGQDAISRMSMQTMKRVIDDMMFALGTCYRPKLSILLDTLIGRYVNASAAPHVFQPFESIDPDVKEVLQQYLARAQLHQKDVDTRPMYPPGRIIFLRPSGNLTNNSKDITWDAVWIHAQDLMDEGILVSKRALSHHLLGQGMVALEKALESCRQRDGGQRA
ncbi:hypothetical protein PSENEW3_00005904 [Picochlorum sp. SENEW3]|nr:hypothetical protein PSENEW3_00005904 [Picochlorum sp. SENEW3]